MLAATLLALAVASASPAVDDSVALLFHQSEDGGMTMNCTATAFDRKGEDTWFLTAAHCVTEEGEDSKDKVTEDPLFLSSDDRDVKAYVRATLVEVGKREKGYDYAILSARLTLPLIALGDERKERPHVDVVTVGAPTGIGKAYDKGVMSLRYIDRPLFSTGQKINWAGCMLVRIQSEGGSSGSAIVSADTNTIIGVLVGGKAGLTIAVPVSRVAERDSEFVLYPKQKKNTAAP